MAKTKKITEPQVAEPETAAVIIEQEPEPPPPVVRERHNVHRTWVKEIPLDEIDDEEDAEPDEEPEEDEPAPVEITDPIEAAVAEMAGSSSEWEIHVFRLPNYRNDQRTDPKSRTFAGKLPIPDADYLRNDRYLEDLQLRFADRKTSNFFSLAIRRDRQVFRWINGISVEPLPVHEMAQRAQEGGAPFVPYPPLLFSEGNGGDFEKFIKTLKQLQQIGMIPNFAQQQPAAQPNPPLTPETALVTLIASNDDAMSKLSGGIMSRLGLLAGGDGETNFWGFIRDAILQPDIARGFGALMQGVAAALTAQPAQQPIVQPVPPPQPQPVAVPQPPAQPVAATETPQASGAEAQLWGWIFQMIAQQPPPEWAAQQVEVFLSQHPELDMEGGSFDRFINSDPLVFVDQMSRNADLAPILQRPGAVEWITAFQDAVSTDTDEQPQPQEAVH